MKSCKLFAVYESKKGIGYIHLLRKFDHFVSNRHQKEKIAIDYQCLKSIDNADQQRKYLYLELNAKEQKGAVTYVKLPCISPIFVSETIKY